MTPARQAPRLARFLVCISLAPVLWACGGTEPAGPGEGDSGVPDSTTSGDAGSDVATSGYTGAPTDSQGGLADVGATDGGGAPDAACVPGCPASMQCGRYTDCTGNTLICGSPCPKGQSCVAGLTTQTCQPTASACTGKCGIVGVDACGIAIGCGAPGASVWH